MVARRGSVAIGEQRTASSTRGWAVAHRRRDIQGLRAIAVLIVVAFHAGLPAPGGFVGVDVFFVISGFVITAMLHREWATTGRIRFGRFYLRRFKRLTPALALTVAVTLLISAIVLSPLGPQQTVAKTGIGAMLLAANFVIARTTGGYFDAPAETNPLLNTWSLSVEEQFYLVFPALIALGWYLARRRGWLRFSPHLIVGAIAVVSFALAMASASGLTFRESGTILGFYSPFTRAWEFAVGALLALALARWTPHAPRLMTLLGATGLLMLAASLWLITDTTPFPGPWTTLPVTGTLLLLLSGTNVTAPTSRALSTTPMVTIGDWSYSIYLWHWPFIVFAVYLWPQSTLTAPVAAIVSMAPALASYRWVEKPIRAIQAISPTEAAALVSAVLFPPILIAAAIVMLVAPMWQRVYESDRITGFTEWSSLVETVQREYGPCIEPLRSVAQEAQGYIRCSQTTRESPVRTLVLGDSHAEPTFRALTFAYPNASIGYLTRFGELPSRSPEWSEIVDLTRRSDSIRTVVISGFWAFHSGEDYAPDLRAVLKALSDSGKTVFVIDDWPTYPFPAIDCGVRIAPVLPARRCTIDASWERATASAVRQRLTLAAQGLPNVRILDTRSFFCDSEVCSMTNGSKSLYADQDHLNVTGAQFLGDSIRLLYPNVGERIASTE